MDARDIVQGLLAVGLCTLAFMLYKLRRDLMSTKAELEAAIAAEKEEVKARVDALEETVRRLEEQQAGGEPVSPEQFRELIAQVQGIHTPTTPGGEEPTPA